MSDIVERLRNGYKYPHQLDIEWISEAANEIERLRVERRILVNQRDSWEVAHGNLRNRTTTAEARIAALESACRVLGAEVYTWRWMADVVEDVGWKAAWKCDGDKCGDAGRQRTPTPSPAST